MDRKTKKQMDRHDGWTDELMDGQMGRQMDGHKGRRSGQIKDLQTDKRKIITDCPLWGRCFKSNATADWLVYNKSNFYGKKVIGTVKPHENVLPLFLPFPSNN
jgi:hypothetical protein